MLRYPYAIAVLPAALTTLIALLAHGQPRPGDPNPLAPQSPSEQLFDATTPICYIRLENGQLRDLRHLCGKKLTSPTPLRNVQRPSVPSDVDADDESAPSVTPRPQATASPAATTSPSPIRSPVASPPAPAPGRPTNVQPSPTSPPTIVPSEPHPLAIPQDRD